MLHRIPDVMRYYKDLIVDAQYEVILATNYWEPSWGSHLFVQHFPLSYTPAKGHLPVYTMRSKSSPSVQRVALRSPS